MVVDYFIVEELCEAEVADLLGEDVLVEDLLLHEVSGGDGDVEDGHSGSVALTRVDPALTDVVSDVRAVAAREAETRSQVESGHWWRSYEPLDIDVVLQRQLDDGVAGAAGLNFHGAPRVGDVHELRRCQIVLGDVHGPLQFRVRRGFDVQRQRRYFADSMTYLNRKSIQINSNHSDSIQVGQNWPNVIWIIGNAGFSGSGSLF